MLLNRQLDAQWPWVHVAIAVAMEEFLHGLHKWCIVGQPTDLHRSAVVTFYSHQWTRTIEQTIEISTMFAKCFTVSAVTQFTQFSLFCLLVFPFNFWWRNVNRFHCIAPSGTRPQKPMWKTDWIVVRAISWLIQSCVSNIFDSDAVLRDDNVNTCCLSVPEFSVDMRHSSVRLQPTLLSNWCWQLSSILKGRSV